MRDGENDKMKKKYGRGRGRGKKKDNYIKKFKKEEGKGE
jgi:hypothetical protein